MWEAKYNETVTLFERTHPYQDYVIVRTIFSYKDRIIRTMVL